MTDAVAPHGPPLAGVIGWPIDHSLSPRLHGHWLQRYGISGHYVPMGVRPNDFEAAIQALPKLGFLGVNLTIPFKETILGMATSVSDRASLIGAANTLVFRDGAIIADNTDAYGFIESIRQAAPTWRGDSGPALVLGAGGASRAVVHALLSEGAPEIRLANRTRQRGEILRDQFGAKLVIVDWNQLDEAASSVTTVVNTTALGMTDKPEVPMTLRLAAADTLVVDIVYRPGGTGLIHAATARGLQAIDGIGMLLHQAVPGFESWFGTKPEVDEALRLAVLGQ